MTTIARRVLCTIAASALLAPAACMTVGSDFPTAPVERIEIGETTRDEIRSWFGEPFRTGLEDGQRTWTYGRYRYSAFGDPSTKDLVVRFDARGRVASYSFNSTDPSDLGDAR